MRCEEEVVGGGGISKGKSVQVLERRVRQRRQPKAKSTRGGAPGSSSISIFRKLICIFCVSNFQQQLNFLTNHRMLCPQQTEE